MSKNSNGERLNVSPANSGSNTPSAPINPENNSIVLASNGVEVGGYSLVRSRARTESMESFIMENAAVMSALGVNNRNNIRSSNNTNGDFNGEPDSSSSSVDSAGQHDNENVSALGSRASSVGSEMFKMDDVGPHSS